MQRIVFSDVDGTLLDSGHHLLPGTLRAIRTLQRRGIPFVIVSARSPSGIVPILEEHDFRSPLICYSGALILDEEGRVLSSRGFSKALAGDLIAFLEKTGQPCAWNVYSGDTWIVRDRTDPRVAREEAIVRACAVEGGLELLPGDAVVGKILCMCQPGTIEGVQSGLKKAFPSLSITPSSDVLLEVMETGVNKAEGIGRLCGLWGISLKDAVAFGDHYNDLEMLEAVGTPFLMGNAPEALRTRFPLTDSNDQDGILHALEGLGMV
jgi:Cof subfamily protein (haloacid dehalogenase superfamily)